MTPPRAQTITPATAVVPAYLLRIYKDAPGHATAVIGQPSTFSSIGDGTGKELQQGEGDAIGDKRSEKVFPFPAGPAFLALNSPLSFP